MVSTQIEIGIDLPNDGDYAASATPPGSTNACRDSSRVSVSWSPTMISGAECASVPNCTRSAASCSTIPRPIVGALGSTIGNTACSGFRPQWLSRSSTTRPSMPRAVASTRTHRVPTRVPLRDRYADRLAHCGCMSHRGHARGPQERPRFRDFFPTDGTNLYGVGRRAPPGVQPLSLTQGFINRLDRCATTRTRRSWRWTSRILREGDCRHARQVGVEPVDS